jgi:hypothetical protein
MTDATRPDTGRAHRVALWLFAVASLPAVAAGAAVMSMAGLPLGLWIRNPAAWLAAGALSLVLVRSRWLGLVMPPLALAVIALSFLGPGQEGVHRWIGLGPIQLNAAALVLPAAIGAFAGDRLGYVFLALIAALLAAQPDISQLAGFSAAAMIIALARFGWKGALASALIATGAIALCLLRPDALAPVAHVEGIVFEAWNRSLVLSVVMEIGLVASSLLPLIFLKQPELRWRAGALSAYFVLTASAFLFGAYPVPLAGYGLSFVIGWWLGVAALAAGNRGRTVNSLTET